MGKALEAAGKLDFHSRSCQCLTGFAHPLETKPGRIAAAPNLATRQLAIRPSGANWPYSFEVALRADRFQQFLVLQPTNTLSLEADRFPSRAHLAPDPQPLIPS